MSMTEYELVALLSKHELSLATLTNSGVDAVARSEWVNVLTYGATGSYGETVITDDTAFINLAIAATPVGGTLYFPPCRRGPVSDSLGGYRTTSTLTIPDGINVIMDAPIYTVSGVGIQIGNDVTKPERTKNRTYKLWAIKSVLSDWSSEADIGIRLQNLNSCQIQIVQADNYTIGVQTIGDGRGFGYNTFYLGQLADNKIGLDITAKYNATVGASGWNNENLYIGGRWSSWKGSGTTAYGQSRYGVRITSDGTIVNGQNHFYKPSFEMSLTNAQGVLGGSSTSVAIPFLLEQNSVSHFMDIRHEGNSSVLAIISNTSSYNKFEIGYEYYTATAALATLTDNSTIGFNSLKSIQTDHMTEFPLIPVFDSGNLGLKSNSYSTTGTSSSAWGRQIYTQGLSYMSSSATATTRKYGDAGLMRDTFVYYPSTAYRPYINVDTTVQKKFVVKKGGTVAYPVSIGVACYNSSGARIGSNVLTYVKGTPQVPFTWTDNFGGAYFQNTYDLESVFFSVTSDVAYVSVIFNPTSVGSRLKRFAVYAVPSSISSNAAPAAWSDYPDNGTGYSSRYLPAYGTWKLGQVLWNDFAVSSAYAGWICTLGGTFCSTAWTASEAIAVGDVRYLTANNRILQCVFSNSGTCSASVTPVATNIGDIVVDNTVTWECIATTMTQPTFKSFGSLV